MESERLVNQQGQKLLYDSIPHSILVSLPPGKSQRGQRNLKVEKDVDRTFQTQLKCQVKFGSSLRQRLGMGLHLPKELHPWFEQKVMATGQE